MEHIMDYQKVIDEILKKEPTLTGTGLNTGKVYSEDPIPEQEFLICIEWVDQKQKTKVINKKAGSSYGFKHLVEKYFRITRGYGRYISNGSVIAALIYRGVPIKSYSDSPNIYAALRKERM